MSATTVAAKFGDAGLPRVLCVDDEPAVLEGLALQLRRLAEVVPANSGAEALALLRSSGPFAVLISDMRMPGMNGIAVLERARRIAPDTVRILLTGHADLDVALAAVNRLQLWRFLVKPCPRDKLHSAVIDGVAQNRLLEAERTLLDETLRGAVRTLVEVLEVAHPRAFGRARRIQRYARLMAASLGVADAWHLEVAASLSQLGCVSLSDETVGRLHAGKPLTEREQVLAARVPQVSAELLGHIPRLEPVRAVLKWMGRSSPRRLEVVSNGELSASHKAELVALAAEVVALETQGMKRNVAIAAVREGNCEYAEHVLDGLILALKRRRRTLVCALTVGELQEGMTLVEDLRTRDGVVLVAKGYELTQSFVRRAMSFAPGSLCEPIHVEVQAA